LIRMNIMARLKAYRKIFIVLGIFIIFSPPLFFSQNLASICNLFQQKEGKPDGPCGHKALSPKASPVELGMGLVSGPVPENAHRLLALGPLPDLFVLFPAQPSSLPLRC
jgi:hypothetical protein